MVQIADKEFRIIFDAAKDGLLLIDGETKHFLLANAALCQMLGYQEDEIMGLQFMDLTPLSNLTPVVDDFTRLLRGKINLVKEMPVKRKDGSVFYADVTGTFIALAEKLYLLASFRDITERKIAQDEIQRLFAQLLNEKRKIDSMIENMVEGIILVSHEGEVEFINPSTRRLLDLEEEKPTLAGVLAHFQDTQIKDLPQRAKIWLKRILEGREDIIKREMSLVPAERIIRVDLEAIKDKAGGVIGALFVLHDITQEKEAENLKSEILSITSHELRTPLAAIKQAIHLVYSETAGPASDSQKRFLDIGRRNVDRLAHLIDELLSLSKMEAGKLKLEKRLGNLNPLISDAVSAFRPLAEEKKLKIEEHLDPNLPEIYFDSARLYQVLANLISNAIKFTGEGGRVFVSTSLYGLGKDYIQVSVEDTGGGIAQEDFANLFKKFQQLDMALNRKIGGTGLGLAVCKQMVELHGGRIWAESEGRDKGSKFIFILPTQLGTREKAVSAAGRKKIIVIDDEADLCATLKADLEAKNYAVITALSGQEGLIQIAEEKPDLIILDLMMPEMDGFAVLEKLKKDPETSALPVVVLTCLEDEEHAKRTLSLGAKAYLVKPFEPEALLFTLQEFLK